MQFSWSWRGRRWGSTPRRRRSRWTRRDQKRKAKKNMFTIAVSFILFFPVFKAWLEESGFLEDVKPKPKPVIGTPRGRSLSPKKRNAVKCKIKSKL